MVAIRTAKLNMAAILIVTAVILYIFLMILGLGPIFIVAIFVLLFLIVYGLYLCSDRLIMAYIGASRSGVPGPLADQVRQYCDERHIPAPPIAVVNRKIPDIFVCGVSKRKSLIVITSGAVAGLSGTEQGEIAISELMVIQPYRAFDLAMTSLILMPLAGMDERSLSSRHMTNGHRAYEPLNEHVTFRKAADSDFLGLYREGTNAFSDSTGFIPLHKLAYLFEKPTAISIIAEYDGVPAGFIIGHLKQGASGIYGHVDAIAVYGQQRGKGIGRGLTMTFLDALKECGCWQCCLEVWQHNEPAIKLYEKTGFVRRAVFEDYYRKGQHAIIMCKNLTIE
jgi:ribosomal protein S18 acetylase RimI-like enzyme